MPRSSVSRKRTARTASAYLVAMPTRAVIHIQNTAPGPPRKIAVATPAIFPVPIVAARDVIRALKGLMPLLSPGMRPFQSVIALYVGILLNQLITHG